MSITHAVFVLIILLFVSIPAGQVEPGRNITYG